MLRVQRMAGQKTDRISSVLFGGRPRRTGVMVGAGAWAGAGAGAGAMPIICASEMKRLSEKAEKARNN